jgi:hypothetical protein
VFYQEVIAPMKITIQDDRNISAIQNEFNKAFPYLKIEFFSRAFPGGSFSKRLKQPDKTLGECRTIHNSGSITITPSMTVADLEQNFSTVYGLSTQIFRKSGKAWLETTLTNGWTLKEQNEEGAALSG